MEQEILNKNLKRRVMLQIHLQFWRTKILERAPYVLPIILLFILLTSVSVNNIVQNLSYTNINSIWSFIFIALRDTELFTQTIFGGFVLSLGLPILRKAFSNSIWRSSPILRAS